MHKLDKIKYSTNKEIREIEEFAFDSKYEVYGYLYRNISKSDATEFKRSVSDLSKKIRTIIKNDVPRSEIVKATEEVLGFKPSFAYQIDNEDDFTIWKKQTRDYIVEVLSDGIFQYIPNDEMSESEFLKNLNDANEFGRASLKSLYKHKGYMKYYEYPWVTPIADFYSSDKNCNIGAAAYWLSNQCNTYREKITYLQGIIYIYYRLNEECAGKDESTIGLKPKMLLIDAFHRRNVLSNSLNYFYDTNGGREAI